MDRSRTILIAGAGVGGLTAALALARSGQQVVVLEAAQQLTDAGAGIQLAPNAMRVLASLGLADDLQSRAVAPAAIRILHGRSGREIVRIPLGADAERRYGAPYWVMHRADLQRALLAALERLETVTLRLGATVVDHAPHADGVTVAAKTPSGVLVQEHGAALIGADGLWSQVRRNLGHNEPRFRRRLALRTTVPAQAVAAAWREPMTNLWLGRNAHLVHYPVRGGAAVNMVAIISHPAEVHGWDAPADHPTALRSFRRWCAPARELLDGVAQWQTWSLYDLVPFRPWSRGPVTLIGDAAHPMLPFLAQGGAMAVEDAGVLAHCVARSPDDLAAGFHAYEDRRYARTARVAAAAARNGAIYHLPAPLSSARNAVMRGLGGERLRARYDWLYDWHDD